jgi:DNA repair protein RecO (recombination protein O)
VTPETGDLLRSLIAGEWDAVDAASPQATAAASGLIAAYAQWHLERGLRSLRGSAAHPVA